jgi:hypothetical protein
LGALVRQNAAEHLHFPKRTWQKPRPDSGWRLVRSLTGIMVQLDRHGALLAMTDEAGGLNVECAIFS